MKRFLLVAAVLVAILLLPACNPNSSFTTGIVTLKGKLIMVSGWLIDPVAAGDTSCHIGANGASSIYSNTVIPRAITSGPVVLIRSGSRLMEGSISGSALQILDVVTNTTVGTAPLDANGVLLKDILIPLTAPAYTAELYLRHPIDYVGSLSFSNGVAVTVKPSALWSSLSDKEMSYVVSADTSAPAGSPAGSLTANFTSSDPSTHMGQFGIFLSSLTNGSIGVNGTTPASVSPFTNGLLRQGGTSVLTNVDDIAQIDFIWL